MRRGVHCSFQSASKFLTFEVLLYAPPYKRPYKGMPFLYNNALNNASNNTTLKRIRQFIKILVSVIK